MTEPVVLAPARLAALVRDIFAKHGMSDAHATLVADALVWAEMRGMDTHGVMRAPRYVDLIRKGDLNPAPHIQRPMEAEAAVVLDCDHAAGCIVGLCIFYCFGNNFFGSFKGNSVGCNYLRTCRISYNYRYR